MRFRLFLSHSTAQPDRTRLARIAQDIETQSDGKMKVLWDGGQISGGDDWRARIVDLLHACDGAAILLDEPALDSKWVLAESTFLLLARCRDKDFLTVPVRLAPAEVVQRRLGDPDWAPVPLLHKQMVPATFDDLAVTVVKAFEEAAARGPGHSLSRCWPIRSPGTWSRRLRRRCAHWPNDSGTRCPMAIRPIMYGLRWSWPAP